MDRLLTGLDGRINSLASDYAVCILSKRTERAFNVTRRETRRLLRTFAILGLPAVPKDLESTTDVFRVDISRKARHLGVGVRRLRMICRLSNQGKVDYRSEANVAEEIFRERLLDFIDLESLPVTVVFKRQRERWDW